MQKTELQIMHADVLTRVTGDQRASAKGHYNERLISVQKVGTEIALVFLADRGNESSRGVRTVVLSPRYIFSSDGTAPELKLVVTKDQFISTGVGVPDTSRKGSTDEFHAQEIVLPGFKKACAGPSGISLDASRIMREARWGK